MAQFAVHRNVVQLRETVLSWCSPRSSKAFVRRVVVPLVKASTVDARVLRVLNPEFRIRSVAVVLHPLDVVSVPVDQLGERVGSLADSADAIVRALDEALTRAWK